MYKLINFIRVPSEKHFKLILNFNNIILIINFN